jgi:hypothetical protein
MMAVQSPPSPRICSPFCYPFGFQRQPRPSAAPIQSAESYVYFGLELYQYPHVLQDPQLSSPTEPHPQVRLLPVGLGDERLNVPLISLTHGHRPRSHLHSSSHHHSRHRSRSSSLVPSPTPYVTSSLRDLIYPDSDHRSQAYLPSPGLAPMYADKHSSCSLAS